MITGKPLDHSHDINVAVTLTQECLLDLSGLWDLPLYTQIVFPLPKLLCEIFDRLNKLHRFLSTGQMCTASENMGGSIRHSFCDPLCDLWVIKRSGFCKKQSGGHIDLV